MTEQQESLQQTTTNESTQDTQLTTEKQSVEQQNESTIQQPTTISEKTEEVKKEEKQSTVESNEMKIQKEESIQESKEQSSTQESTKSEQESTEESTEESKTQQTVTQESQSTNEESKTQESTTQKPPVQESSTQESTTQPVQESTEESKTQQSAESQSTKESSKQPSSEETKNDEEDEEYIKMQQLARARRTKLDTTRKRVAQFAKQPALGETQKEILQNKICKAAFSEMQGKRPYMEDAHTILFNYRNREDEVFVGVYDGHGGREAALYVSQELHKIFEKKMNEFEKNRKGVEVKRLNEYLTKVCFLQHQKDIQEQKENNEEQTSSGGEKKEIKSKVELEDSIEPVDLSKLSEHDAILALMRESFLEMSAMVAQQKISNGTTATVAYIRGQYCYIANVGDSRAVLCRGGKPIRLTVDHRPSNENEQRRIRELGGSVSNNRVNAILAVARAIGDNFLEPIVTADPYTRVIGITKDDEFLVVACDGLYDTVADKEVVELAKKENDPRVASALLRDTAYKNGSTDNISVAFIRFKDYVTTDKDEKEKKEEKKEEKQPVKKVLEKAFDDWDT